MTLPKQKFREVLFLSLYANSLGGDSEGTVALVAEQLKLSKKYAKQACDTVQIIRTHLDGIDARIEAASDAYAFHRIPSIEKNILRLAIFEMCCDDSIPEKVAIAEGIRLARKFSTKESAKFINAILDAVFQNIRFLEEASH